MFTSFASLSTVLAVFENILALFIDTFGWSRKKAVVFNFVLILIGSMPCVLGFEGGNDGKTVAIAERFMVY